MWSLTLTRNHKGGQGGEGSEKPFVCDICLKRFIHMIIYILEYFEISPVKNRKLVGKCVLKKVLVKVS